MNYRPNPTNFQDYNRLGYSSVSKGYAYSNRNFEQPTNGGDLAALLQNERRRFKEAKQKYEYDLDDERKRRIEFENKLIKLKDQFSRKDVTISELEFKLNNLLHQNQDVLVENDRLKNQLARMEDIYGARIHQLQNQLTAQTRNFEQTTIQYNTEFEKFKKQGQQYIETLTFQFQRKIKSLQQRLKVAQNTKRDLTVENKKLNDILISNKLAFEEELRDLKNKARDQEIKKGQAMAKNFDQKMKMVEQSKQAIIRKNQELLRTLQDRERAFADLQAQKNDQIDKLRQDSNDLHQQNTHLNYIVNKLKTQIADKDAALGRSLNSNDQQIATLRQQIEIKKQQNNQLVNTNRGLREALKDSELDWDKRRKQLVERTNMMEGEARKYKDEYNRVCELLRNRINDAINGVSTKK